ncbi:cytochrome c [Azospirillum sp. SYSU D00513]|uniref:c-type cytochrome n=1 Tax=Azospirillum sp. SYSU D00513 TaxID=2812561 RepID=UPI001A96EC28|nr:cytochrome c [Azospirillum sp. SYSU D00513]
MVRHAVLPALALLPVLLLGACGDNMAEQHEYADPQAPAVVVLDPLPPGTVPIGALDRAAALANPPEAMDLQRGRERYGIYCAACHGLTGHGDGPVARRGFPPPASFHAEEHRDLPLREIVTVITEGRGPMPAYADRIAAEDRWRIAAYLKALQYSQAVPAEALPPEDRERLPRP